MKLNISNLHINLDISKNICDDCYIGNRGYTISKKNLDLLSKIILRIFSK